MTPELNGLIRNLLAALGGVGVSLGFFDALQVEAVINALMQIIGAAAFLGAIAWTIHAKRAASREAAAIAAKVLEADELPAKRAVRKVTKI